MSRCFSAPRMGAVAFARGRSRELSAVRVCHAARLCRCLSAYEAQASRRAALEAVRARHEVLRDATIGAVAAG